MARRKKTRSIQPAITDIYLKTNTGLATSSHRNYVDTARELSKVNRRLYSQSRMYAYHGLTFIFRQPVGLTTVATIECSVRTAGNSWVVQNAHTKGHALWKQMQSLVTEDNPSIVGKWHDYKVRLCDSQVTSREMSALDGQGAVFGAGEWNLSTYVMPEHSVDAAGNPLAATEFTAVLIGGETTSTRSLVKAYEESRATVSLNQPNVPVGMSSSFFNLLTDSGSQEPELADVIIDENDNPPYVLSDYPGGALNAPDPVTVGYGAISTSEVDGRIGAFVAPCGLLEIEVVGYDAAGEIVTAQDMPSIDILLHVAPGSYKGVMSVEMGQ